MQNAGTGQLAMPPTSIEGDTKPLPRSVIEALLELGVENIREKYRLVGKNNNWRVTSGTGQEYFVKQLIGGPAADIQKRIVSLRNAQTILANAVSYPAMLYPSESLTNLADNDCVVYEYLTNSTPLSELAADKDLSHEIVRSAARALGRVHRVSITEKKLSIDTNLHNGGAGERILNSMSVEQYVDASGAELELWSLLHNDEDLMIAYETAFKKARQCRSAMVHGDLRLDQILLNDEDQKIYFVDWEYSRIGCAAIDLGGILGQILNFSLRRSLRQNSEVKSPDDLVAILESGVAAAASLTEIFWDSYTEERSGITRSEKLLSVSFASWHLVDRVMANSMNSNQLSVVDRAILGIAKEIALDTRKYSFAIGLPSHG